MEKLLTSREVAEILRISPTTAKIWASKRKFPVVKVGRLVRIAPEALDEWVRENTDQAIAPTQKRCSRGPKQTKTGSFESLLGELLPGRAKRGRE
jgi:excisionase family DNA binding protein